jgi:5-methylcytosine-specific restriction protein A
MPYKSKRRCLKAGCPVLVEAGAGYCSEHKPKYKRDTSHYDYRWRKISKLFLSRNPLCEECQKAGRLTPATETHHKIAVSDGGSDCDDNLQALCKSCHSRKTAEEIKFGGF